MASSFGRARYMYVLSPLFSEPFDFSDYVYSLELLKGNSHDFERVSKS